jgi:hypothetical protein
MSNRESICKIIKENRPNLSMSSIKTYCSNIVSIAKKIDSEITSEQDVIDNADKIHEYLKTKPSAARKTLLASLIVFLDSVENKDTDLIDKFRKIMLSDIDEVNKENMEQKLNKKQKDAWIDWNEVLDIYNQLEVSVKGLWNKSELKKSEFLKLQNYVLLSCLVLIPPRRSLDYVNFKLRNIDKSEDNYMLGNEFIFNSFKTAKSAGQQKVKIPTKLKTIITKWKKINTNDYLLVNTRLDNKIDSTQLTNMLNNIFGKNISTSMLRHIHLSHEFKNMPRINELKEKADSMGTSVDMIVNNYIKYE